MIVRSPVCAVAVSTHPDVSRAAKDPSPVSTLDDLIAQLHVVREQVNDSLSHLAGLKSSTEEVLGTYEAVGAEGMAAQAAQIVDEVEGSEATTQSAVPQIEAVIAQAESLKTGGQAGSRDGGLGDSDVATGADATAVPSSQWRNEVGDKVKPVDEPGENPTDRGMGKFQASARSMARGAGRFKEQSENLAKAHQGVGSFKPPVEGSYPTVGTPSSPTPISTSPTHAGPEVHDVVGTLTVMTVLGINAAARGLKNITRKRKNDD